MDEKNSTGVRKSKNLWKWSTFALLILVIVTVVGYFFNVVRIPALDSYGSESQRAVCGKEMVERYNTAFNYTDRGEGKGIAVDNEELNRISSEVESSNGFNDDPTCQSMVFWIAINSRDHDKASKTYEVLSKMHDDGKYADSNLRTNIPFFLYDSQLESIRSGRSDNEEQSAGQ